MTAPGTEDPQAEPTTGPFRVFDLFDPGKPDPVLEAEVAAHHAAYPDPRSYEAKAAWRGAHPDAPSPVHPCLTRSWVRCSGSSARKPSLNRKPGLNAPDPNPEVEAAADSIRADMERDRLAREAEAGLGHDYDGPELRSGTPEYEALYAEYQAWAVHRGPEPEAEL